MYESEESIDSNVVTVSIREKVTHFIEIMKQISSENSLN